MKNWQDAAGIFLLCALAGCSYAYMAAARHYSGTSIRYSDQLINGNGTYSEPVEATYIEFHSNPTLFSHEIQTGLRDTFSFQQRDSAWRLTGDLHGEVKIHRTFDSLMVSLVWGYGGEAFYLKQDSEWAVPVIMMPVSRFRLW